MILLWPRTKATNETDAIRPLYLRVCVVAQDCNPPKTKPPESKGNRGDKRVSPRYMYIHTPREMHVRPHTMQSCWWRHTSYAAREAPTPNTSKRQNIFSKHRFGRQPHSKSSRGATHKGVLFYSSRRKGSIPLFPPLFQPAWRERWTKNPRVPGDERVATCKANEDNPASRPHPIPGCDYTNPHGKTFRFRFSRRVPRALIGRHERAPEAEESYGRKPCNPKVIEQCGRCTRHRSLGQ